MPVATTEDSLEWEDFADTKASPRNAPPGPGAYNADFYGSIAERAMRARQGKLGKSMLGRNFPQQGDHHPLRLRNTPGPLSYHPTKQSVAPSFSLQGRWAEIGKAAEEAYPSPGPGEYTTSGTILKPGCTPTLHGRTAFPPSPFDPKFRAPAPGTYQPPSSIGQAVRMGVHLPLPPKPPVGPGPGEYEPRATLTNATTPKYSMAPRLTPNPLGTFIDAALPGPGAYHIRSACFDGMDQASGGGPGRSFGSKPEQGQGQGSPSVPSDTPGPLTYSVPAPPPMGRPISFAPRPHYRAAEESPGPGQYDVGDTFGKAAQKCSLKGKGPDRAANDNPGPGKYDTSPPFGKGGRSTTLHMRLRDTMAIPDAAGLSPRKREQWCLDQQGKGGLLPGPGQYSPRTELVDEVSRSIGVSIKGKPKQHEEVNDVGPGQYDLPPATGGNPRITIKGRAPAAPVKDRSPGPAHYHPETWNPIGRSGAPRVSISPRRG